jgi:pimeloyl-ACP methyl ester carboxylesterase
MLPLEAITDLEQRFSPQFLVATRSVSRMIFSRQWFSLRLGAHRRRTRQRNVILQRTGIEVRTPTLADRRQNYRDVIVDGKPLETLFFPAAADAPVIVMLHEGLGSIAMWKDFPERVAEATGCSVLVYSRYGHGKSQRLAEKRDFDFMHHEATVVLPELLVQLGIQRPILLGHSDGGSIALIYAGTWPEQVRGLILEAPHVFVEDFGLRSTIAIRTLYGSSDLPQKLSRYHDHADEMFRGWNDIWLDPQFRGWNIEEYLGSISCPTLVIQGEDDEYGTLAHVETIRRGVPNAQALVLPRCGHSPHRDQPEITLDAISKFVASLL